MYVILQKFQTDNTYNLCMQFEEEKDALRTLDGLRKDSKIRKIPVEYKLEEFKNMELQYSGKKSVEDDMGKVIIWSKDGKIALERDLIPKS
jgi:hypothetical protein